VPVTVQRISSTEKGVYLEEETASPSHEHLSEWFHTRTHQGGRGDTQQNRWKRLETRELSVYNPTSAGPRMERTPGHCHHLAVV